MANASRKIARLIVIALLSLAMAAPATAQTSKSKARSKAKTTATTKKRTTKKAATKKPQTISGLKNERAKVNKEIKQQQQKLRDNERNVKQRLQQLVVINSEITDKRKTIDSLRLSIKATEADIRRLNDEIERLQRELEDRKDKYVKSLRYMHRNRSIQSQMMFIFSAESVAQMYRRMRFMREYADYQRAQGEAVKAKQVELEQAKALLAETKRRQSALLARGVKEENKLKESQTEQQRMVESLRKQQKDIQRIIAERQKRNAQIDKEIDRLVAIEIEKARRRAEEEARRKRELAEAKKKSGSKSTSKSKSSPSSEGAWRHEMDAADLKLSNNFAGNKGRLPMPISGSYRIVSRFGQYNVAGLSNVRLDNKGIDILGRPGAKVRSVFDGEVSAVFNTAGVTGIMVRHGSYISVYVGLSSINVKKGQRVTTRQTLGTIGSDNTLQFQLRRERTKLNPEAWLAR